MCGITGTINFSKKPIDPFVLKQMTDVIVHRGPDDSGIYVEQNVGLGHRRLSIIDLSPAGRQPMCNENGQIWITYNGEIYNYRELKKYLVEKGHLFRSDTDTEVILHLYEEYGEKCIQKLRGMFAFAIWDSRTKCLLVVRDRLGIKPLYYYYKDGIFAFSSEIKALLRHPKISAEVNLSALYEYICYRYVVAPNTMFQNIFKLEPGCYIRITPNSFEREKYWEISYTTDKSLNEQTSVEKLYDLIRESVQMRLISDVPLGAFLSGGIDSTTVVALMSQVSNRPVKTFTVGFSAGDEIDELKYAKIVSDYFQTDHHELLVTSASPELLNTIIRHIEEPIGDPAIVPTYLVSELARKYVTVVLTGEGSDEMNGGYHKYLLNYYFYKYKNIPPFMRNLLESRILHYLLPQKVNKYLQMSHWADSERIQYFNFNYFNDFSEQNFFSSAFMAQLKAQTLRCPTQELIGQSGTDNYMNQLFYVDVKSWMLDDLLLKVDKMSMAHSLEARVPFLDHKFVEFAVSIPPGLKFKGFKTKSLLRKTVKSLLPAQIRMRKQHGFIVPLDRWFDGELTDYLDDIFSHPMIKKLRYFNWDLVNWMLNAHKQRHQNFETQIWMLLMLELWHREFIS